MWIHIYLYIYIYHIYIYYHECAAPWVGVKLLFAVPYACTACTPGISK